MNSIIVTLYNDAFSHKISLSIPLIEMVCDVQNIEPPPEYKSIIYTTTNLTLKLTENFDTVISLLKEAQNG